MPPANQDCLSAACHTLGEANFEHHADIRRPRHFRRGGLCLLRGRVASTLLIGRFGLCLKFLEIVVGGANGLETFRGFGRRIAIRMPGHGQAPIGTLDFLRRGTGAESENGKGIHQGGKGRRGPILP